MYLSPLFTRIEPPGLARVRREPRVANGLASGPGPEATALAVDAHLRGNQPVTPEVDRKILISAQTLAHWYTKPYRKA